MSFDTDHLVNPALLGMTKQAGFNLGGFRKHAFVPGGDPGMGGGGGDPSAGGGAPPGGDPGMGGGGAPPGGGGGGGGGGGDPMASLQPMIQQAVQQAMMAQGGGAGGGAGAGAGGQGLKPKIDVNVEIMQIKNMLAKICDHLGIQIPAQDMVATPEKLTAMAQGQSVASAAGTGGGGGGGGAIGGMPPMDPMQGAGMPGGGEKAGSYTGNGRAFDTSGFTAVSNKAQAIQQMRNARRTKAA